MTSFVFLMALIAGPLWAEKADDYDLKSKTRVRVKSGVRQKAASRPTPVQALNPAAAPAPAPNELPPNKVSSPVIQESPSDVRWGGDLRYGLRTDLADQLSPRIYTHTLSLSFGFAHPPSALTLAGILSVNFESMGEREGEILVDSNRTELFVNDFTLVVGKQAKAFWHSTFSFSLANEFPTSPEASREDYSSITYTEVLWTIPLLAEKVSASLSSELYYVWNNLEYSPATGDLNKMGGWRNQLGLRWSIWRGLFISGIVGSELSRYLDNTNDVASRNAVKLGYDWENYGVNLSFSNGTYADQQEADLWFIDDYRRMLSFGATMRF